MPTRRELQAPNYTKGGIGGELTHNLLTFHQPRPHNAALPSCIGVV